MKKIILSGAVTAAVVFIASCNQVAEEKKPIEKVENTFSDGKPSRVSFYDESGTDLVKTVEYYPSDSLKAGAMIYLPGRGKESAAGQVEATSDSSGAIFKEWNFVKGVLNGESRSYYSNGQPWSLHTYRDGLKNGKYQTWHSNGKLYIDGQYAADKEVGIWIFYDETGTKVAERNLDIEPLPAPADSSHH